MMRSLAILCATLCLAACGNAPAARDESQAVSPAPDSVVQFLVASAATDFHRHRPQDPGRIRNVRIGHFAKSTGSEQYMMCGEFLPAPEGGKAEWTAFTTLKMSDYEQYNGPQAGAYCQRSGVIWDKVADLPSTLQSRLDSLR